MKLFTIICVFILIYFDSIQKELKQANVQKEDTINTSKLFNSWIEILESCPQFYNKIVIGTITYCYRINTVDKNCIYQPNSEYIEIRDYLGEIPPIWAPIKRKYSNFYQPFVWTEESINYGRIVTVIRNGNKAAFSCAIFKDKQIEAVDCNANYATICINKYYQSGYQDQCRSSYGDSCFMGSMSGKCFCILKSTRPLNRHEFKPLAEPRDMYQSIMLMNALKLVDSSAVCWIGINKLNEQYVWSSTGSQVSYDYWDPNYSEREQLVAVSVNGWITKKEDEKLHCGIREVHEPTPEPFIDVYYDSLLELVTIFYLNEESIADSKLHCFYGESEKRVITPPRDDFTYSVKVEVKYPTLFWCEAFQFPSKKRIKSNVVVMYSNLGGCNEYSVRMTIITESEPPVSSVQDISELDTLLKHLNQNNVSFRFIDIESYNSHQKQLTFLLHATTFYTDDFNFPSISDDYAKIKKSIENVIVANVVPLLYYRVRSSTVCLERQEIINGSLLTFPETPIGSWVTSLEPCLNEEYQPIIRMCTGDFTQGGYWGDVSGYCSKFVHITNITKQLYQLSIIEDVDDDINTKVNEITNEFKELAKGIDIHLTSRILDKLTEVKVDQNVFFNTINNIMNVDKTTLNYSQTALNSTDKILYNIDKLILGWKSLEITTPKLLVRRMKKSSEVIGAIISSNSSSNFQHFKFENLFNKSLTEQLNGDFEMAIVLPDTQTTDYFITIFKNDNLFNQDSSDDRIMGSWIVSVLIPYQSIVPVHIYFKHFKKNITSADCVYWNYGNNESNFPINGTWKTYKTPINFRENISLCQVNHTTHFTLLIKAPIDLDEIDKTILDFLTIFGTILSILGIIILFLTAILFKNWRSNPSNKIVLNVAFCLFLLITLWFISNLVKAGYFCIIVGTCLHYVLLSKFCWMLIISYSNFRRLILGLHYHIENVVIKYCLIAWGLPLLVPITAVSILPQNYNKSNKSQLCFAKGIVYNLGVIVPLSLMLLTNLFIYIAIIYTISKTTNNLRKHVVKKSYSTHKSALLLFFLMGLTWAFGILSIFDTNAIYYYIFALTTSLQGFIMFVYYILDFTNSRELWKNYLQDHGWFKSPIKNAKELSESDNTTETRTK